MTRLPILLVVLSAGMCVGQESIMLGPPVWDYAWCSSHGDLGCKREIAKANKAQPAPLKCGKYEHVELVSACGVGPRPAFDGCSDVLHETCAPDLHTVTEKEWQDIMERLKWVENNKACSVSVFPMTGGMGRRFKMWPDGSYSDTDPGVGLPTCTSVDWAKNGLKQMRRRGWEISPF